MPKILRKVLPPAVIGKLFPGQRLTLQTLNDGISRQKFVQTCPVVGVGNTSGRHIGGKTHSRQRTA